MVLVVKNPPANARDIRDAGSIPGMATHFSIFSWRILWTEEPGGLQSMGLKESDMRSQRVRHD